MDVVFSLLGVEVALSGGLGFFPGVTTLWNYVLLVGGPAIIGATAFVVATDNLGKCTLTNGWLVFMVAVTVCALAAIGLQFV